MNEIRIRGRVRNIVTGGYSDDMHWVDAASFDTLKAQLETVSRERDEFENLYKGACTRAAQIEVAKSNVQIELHQAQQQLATTKAELEQARYLERDAYNRRDAAIAEKEEAHQRGFEAGKEAAQKVCRDHAELQCYNQDEKNVVLSCEERIRALPVESSSHG